MQKCKGWRERPADACSEACDNTALPRPRCFGAVRRRSWLLRGFVERVDHVGLRQIEAGWPRGLSVPCDVGRDLRCVARRRRSSIATITPSNFRSTPTRAAEKASPSSGPSSTIFAATTVSPCRGAHGRPTNVGDTIRVWIVNVDGTRPFFAAATTEQANARLRNEVHQIVQTIRFG